MRVVVCLCAVWLFTLPSNAKATFYSNLSIWGLMTGTQYTVVCSSSNQCTQGPVETPFSMEFNRVINGSYLPQGDTAFSIGFYRGGGQYSGIITNTDGYLTGSNLTFFLDSSCFPTFPVGCSYSQGTAATFNVIGGIPEPKTWAMMLMGFGAIGYSMRRRRRTYNLMEAT